MMATFIRYREALPVQESLASYTTWTATTGLEANIEELCNGAKLLWVGPKRLDKVMLYCHGELRQFVHLSTNIAIPNVSSQKRPCFRIGMA